MYGIYHTIFFANIDNFIIPNHHKVILFFEYFCKKNEKSYKLLIVTCHLLQRCSVNQAFVSSQTWLPDEIWCL